LKFRAFAFREGLRLFTQADRAASIGYDSHDASPAVIVFNDVHARLVRHESVYRMIVPYSSVR